MKELIGIIILTIIIHLGIFFLNYKDRKFQIFHDVTTKMTNIGTSIKDFKPKDYPLWDSAILNQAEYMAYLVKKNKIDFNLLAGHWDIALIHYFEEIVLKRYKNRLGKKDKFCFEFKELYHRLKRRIEK